MAEAAAKRVKGRMTILQKFLMQAELRCQRIQNDLLEMTIDDIERGWATAYGIEYEMLNHQITMGKEELRIQRYTPYILLIFIQSLSLSLSS